jgi:hypothetical protein
MKLSLIFLISGIFVTVLPAYAISFSLNDSSYIYGDQITISGKITPVVEGQFIGLQILNPTKSDIVTIDQFLPKKDGSFAKTFKAQGPKWSSDGAYTIKIVYNGESLEKIFQFRVESPEISDTISDPTQETSTPQTPLTPIESPKLKIKVEGFPDPNKPPQYYINRYHNELEFKEWFDKFFAGYTIDEIVGYKKTHVSAFPNNENSPWYYVERYNNEPIYKDWFDSQFPRQTIFDVLGYSESEFQKVPGWIKNNAKWWSAGLIGDSDFLSGIQYLIKENIIVITNLPEAGTSDIQTVPVWIKNTAQWWADGLIDENEFLKGIQFLIENGIIIV